MSLALATWFSNVHFDLEKMWMFTRILKRQRKTSGSPTRYELE